MTTAVSVRNVRNSPFRESEWDSRLDHLLQDLENSTQRSQSTDRQVYAAASNSVITSSVGHLSKSKSTSSLTGAATDNMLKDLDTALKASTNYIESHRTVQLPNGTQEYHESRYTSSSGVPPSSGGDFNLERQVQHMMPSNYSTSLNSNQQYSGLQSANMVSSMQTSTSKQSYTSYKVQSNSYSSRNLDFQDQADQDRPGSRLKANIDELDTLLSDLNNAQSTNNTSSRHHETSSEDYGDHGMQGHVKKTITSMNEYTMSSGTSGDYNRKPPSPSPKRRTPVMSSPVPRRCSPSPANRKTSPPPVGGAMVSNTMSSSNYSYNQSSGYNQSSAYNYNSSRGSSPPRKRSPSPRMDSATPTGHAYYSKYHSSYSQQQQQSGPASFPSCPSPSPNRGPTVQTPPKRVDDLMTELSEFDPSIQHTGFKEPVAPARSNNKYSSSHMSHVSSHMSQHDEEDSRYKKREPSPIRPVKQPSAPGPAVYYPPGELFSSTRNSETLKSDMSQPVAPAGQVSHATTLETSDSARGRAKMRAEYGYKEKGRYSEGDTKQGAAVVPICLPLCCAAPCVIL